MNYKEVSPSAGRPLRSSELNQIAEALRCDLHWPGSTESRVRLSSELRLTPSGGFSCFTYEANQGSHYDGESEADNNSKQGSLVFGLYVLQKVNPIFP